MPREAAGEAAACHENRRADVLFVAADRDSVLMGLFLAAACHENRCAEVLLVAADGDSNLVGLFVAAEGVGTSSGCGPSKPPGPSAAVTA